MAVHDKLAGPILGQHVLHQVTGTHNKASGLINGVNSTISVNICQCPEAGSVTWVNRATSAPREELYGATADDGCFAYPAYY